MKKSFLGALFISAVLCGCASSGGGKTYTGKDGVTYREEHDIQGVWMADGFDFKNYVGSPGTELEFAL